MPFCSPSVISVLPRNTGAPEPPLVFQIILPFHLGLSRSFNDFGTSWAATSLVL